MIINDSKEIILKKIKDVLKNFQSEEISLDNIFLENFSDAPKNSLLKAK